MALSHPKNILLIDNFDSFTFNIAQMVSEVNGRDVIVLDNRIPWQEIRKIPHDRIILSPGPGHPQVASDVGSTMDILARAGVPVLGVCLGHQALALHNGCNVIRAAEPLHGRVRPVHHFGDPLFKNIPQKFDVTRYHSLIVEKPLTPSLKIIAQSDEGLVMALRHRFKPHWGVQFHPESICSEYGMELFSNFLSDHIILPNPELRPRSSMEPL